ncbi:MAG: cellulase family glycosylhydrolase [Anaerolineae bacterium]
MPRYGFNFQWIFSNHDRELPQEPDEKALDFLAKHGFDFVRIPCSYWFWTKDFDYYHPDEAVLAYLDRYLAACQQRGLHMNLNLHRAPGYCINRNDLEKHNLWADQEAQDAFVFLWELFAQRYKGVPNAQVSFDLLNEPPSVGDYGFTRDIHQQVMRRTVAAIRAVDPTREIAIDGLGAGHLAIPELADLGVIHSTRGYQPMPVSHWGATWWTGWNTAPAPVYPGVEWEGKVWNKETLRQHFAPWREVEAKGVAVHIGEFGCYNQTPNDVALRWLGDLLSLWHAYGWGYAMWEFKGAFGIAEHGRPDAVYEMIDGFKVDKGLLELLVQNRVS